VAGFAPLESFTTKTDMDTNTRRSGPEQLETAHEHSLAHKLQIRGISFGRPISLPTEYVTLDAGYRLDLLGRAIDHRRNPG
jgi:hypothetical protein